MERKRRARINESLNELKSLVLTGMKKDVSTTMLNAIILVKRMYHRKDM